MLDYVNKLKKPYIVCGDFNKPNIKIDETILKDVAKELEKENIITIATGLERIDYIFVSDDIEILEYDVLIESMSDHYPIIAKLRL